MYTSCWSTYMFTLLELSLRREYIFVQSSWVQVAQHIPAPPSLQHSHTCLVLFCRYVRVNDKISDIEKIHEDVSINTTTFLTHILNATFKSERLYHCLMQCFLCDVGEIVINIFCSKIFYSMAFSFSCNFATCSLSCREWPP